MDEVPERCPGCIDLYQRRNPPQDPPCDTCRVELMPENFDAAMIYQHCKNQVLVAGMGAVIGLNHLAVWEAIDRYGIKNPIECFEKVNFCFSHMQSVRKNKETEK